MGRKSVFISIVVLSLLFSQTYADTDSVSGKNNVVRSTTDFLGQKNVILVAANEPGLLDKEMWEMIKTSTDITDFESYLEEFPDGFYRKLAKFKIRKLNKGKKPEKEIVSKKPVSSGVVVLDEKTGLTWELRGPGPKTWKDAKRYCRELTLDGHMDWRLPQKGEVKSLIDIKKGFLDYPTSGESYYWTSSTNSTSQDYAFGMYAGSGQLFEDGPKESSYFVRCTRGGVLSAEPGLFVDKTTGFSVEYPVKWGRGYKKKCGSNAVFGRASSDGFSTLCIFVQKDRSNGFLGEEWFKKYRSYWKKKGDSWKVVASYSTLLANGTPAYYIRYSVNNSQTMDLITAAVNGNRVSIGARSDYSIGETLSGIVKSLAFVDGAKNFAEMKNRPKPEKAESSDKVIIDDNTGLMWQLQRPDAKIWQDAKRYCKELTIDGYVDWRLPHKDELSSLVAIKGRFEDFAIADDSYYWSSTTNKSDLDEAFGFSTESGKLIDDGDKDDPFLVRCVRGGFPSADPGVYINETLRFAVDYPAKWSVDTTEKCGPNAIFGRTDPQYGNYPTMCITAIPEKSNEILVADLFKKYRADWSSNGYNLKLLDSYPILLANETIAFYFKSQATGRTENLIVDGIIAIKHGQRITVDSWTIYEVDTPAKVVRSLTFQ